MPEKDIFKNIVDTSPTGIVIFQSVRDEPGKLIDFQCTYTNPKAQAIMQASASVMMGSRLSARLRESNAWLLEEYKKVVNTGEPYNTEFLYDHEVTGHVWFRVVTTRMEEGDGFISTFSDITNEKHAQDDLVKNEEKYRRIFENVQDVFYQTDPEGIVTEISPSIQLYSGFSREEIIGHPVSRFYYYEEDRQKLAEQLYKTGRVDDFEVRLKTKDKRLVYTSVNCHVMMGQDGKLKGAEGSMRDISDRKAKEEMVLESVRKMSVFISQAPSAIAMLDRNMNYMVVSQRWNDDFSFAAQDFTDRNHYEVFPHIGEATKEVHRRCLSGAVEKKAEDSLNLEGGINRWLKWEIRPWYETEDSIGGLLIFTEDITEQKKQQDEIGALFKELQEINRQKDKLFSIVAHDLRGPFASFTSMFDMVFEEYDKISREELRQYLDLLKASSGSVSLLLEDLLLWARNQLDRISFEPIQINLRKKTDKVLAYLSPQAQAKQIRLHTDVQEDISVHADIHMLETVIRNLVSNAIKFSNPGGEVMVSAVWKDGMAEVCVRDQGTGIKEEDLAKLFDKASVHTTYGTGGEKGSGIGLDLCGDFVEKHGGMIWVESEYGKGSTFRFTVPDSEA